MVFCYSTPNRLRQIMTGLMILRNNYFRCVTGMMVMLKLIRASLVVQWLRVCLPMQGTRF